MITIPDLTQVCSLFHSGHDLAVSHYEVLGRTDSGIGVTVRFAVNRASPMLAFDSIEIKPTSELVSCGLGAARLWLVNPNCNPSHDALPVFTVPVIDVRAVDEKFGFLLLEEFAHHLPH